MLQNKEKHCQHILVIRLSSLGDVAISIPVLYSIAESNPTVQFSMLTQAVASKLFINPPTNVHVIKAEVRGRHKGFRGIWRLFIELRPLHIDGVADLHNVLRSKWLRKLLLVNGAKVKHIDKGREEKKALLKSREEEKQALKPSFERYFDVFKAFNLNNSHSFRSIYGKGSGDAALFSNICTPKVVGEKWIGVAPFAKHEGKIYPHDLMDQVISMLNTKGYKIFLFGSGTKEEAILSAWDKCYNRCISVGGKHGFAVELSLMSYLDCMISMDSANMHLASLVATPVISIWGGTHYYAGFLGWKQPLSNIIDADMECRPCSIYGNKPCKWGDFRCMRTITPQEIIKKVTTVISAE